MKEVKVLTDDLYCGAYILSKGGALAEIKVNRNGARKSPSTALFVFTGPKVLDLHQDFLSGTAIVNLREFKASMIHLKDQMFAALRCEKEDERYEPRRTRA